ncbi:MAG: hypothetical protein K6T86_14855 [Pirellulales bacterium]|jgi:hypothetical protein|nr:hypothetical protein [Pirellulales bacterium]
MSDDTAQLEAIKRQTLAVLAEITAQPKPSYMIDGQAVSWTEYLAQLRATVAWCDERLAAAAPFEVASQAGT